MSVQKLFQYNLAILLFKLLTNKLLFHFIDLKYLTNFNPTRFAANSNYLLPLVSTNYGKMNSHFSAIANWNSLPDEIKSLSSLSSFKRHLKKFLLECWMVHNSHSEIFFVYFWVLVAELLRIVFLAKCMFVVLHWVFLNLCYISL